MLQGLRDFGFILTGVGVYGTSLLAHSVTLNRFEPAYTGSGIAAEDMPHIFDRFFSR